LVKRLCPQLTDGGFRDGLRRFDFLRSQFVHVGNSLIFYGNDGVHGFEPWRTDGTADGTFLMADIVPGPASEVELFAPEFVSMLGRTYVVNNQSREDGGRELWEAFEDGGLLNRGHVGEGSFYSTDAGAYLLSANGLWHVVVDATGAPKFSPSAVNSAGYTDLRGLEVVKDRIFTVGRLPPGYSRNLIELSPTGAKSVYSRFWSQFNGGTWFEL
jgi:ELWxxDGT repeat protein